MFNVQVRDAGYYVHIFSPTHTHTCVRSSTWWVRTRNGHKVGRTHFSLGGTYTKTLAWLLKILIDMHWWDLNTKSFRRFSAIKNTY